MSTKDEAIAHLRAGGEIGCPMGRRRMIGAHVFYTVGDEWRSMRTGPDAALASEDGFYTLLPIDPRDPGPCARCGHPAAAHDNPLSVCMAQGAFVFMACPCEGYSADREGVPPFSRAPMLWARPA